MEISGSDSARQRAQELIEEVINSQDSRGEWQSILEPLHSLYRGITMYACV